MPNGIEGKLLGKIELGRPKKEVEGGYQTNDKYVQWSEGSNFG